MFNELGLCIGDIKRIKGSFGEIVGVIHSVGDEVGIITTEGVTENVSINTIDSVTTVRLDPVIRENLTKISTLLQQGQKLIGDIQNIRMLQMELEGEMIKAVGELRSNIGFYTEKKFIEELWVYFDNRTFNNFSRKGYRIELSKKVNKINLVISRLKLIDKNPPQGNYSFLQSKLGNQANKIVEQYKSSDVNFGKIPKKTRHVKGIERKTSILKDNSLFYIHEVVLIIDSISLDKYILDEVIEILS